MTPEEARDKIFTNWGEFYGNIKEIYIAATDTVCTENFPFHWKGDAFQILMHFLLYCHCRGIINRREAMWILQDAVRIMEPPTQKKFMTPTADIRRRRFRRIFPSHE